MLRIVLISLCVLVTAIGIGTARAEDTRIEATIGERLGYDDNIGWNRSGEVSDLSSQTALGLNFSNRDEVLEFDLDTRFLFTQFLEEDNLNSNDQFVTGEVAYRTPRSRTGVSAEYRRDTSRTGQEDDTGAFLLDNIRQQESNVRPYWSFQATRLDRFTAEAEYRNIDYDRTLTDNDRFGGALGWAHALSEADEISLTVDAGQIDFDTNDDRQVRIIGIEAGWTTELTPQMQANLGVGPYWADLSSGTSGPGSTPDDDTVGVLANAGLSYQPDSETTLEASYRRFVAPSGGGNAVIRDRVDASFDQDWSARVFWGLALRLQHQEAAFDDGSPGRDFVRVSPSIGWRLTEDWVLRGSYRFRWQSVDGADGDAISNAAFVTLTFRPEGWSLSQ